MKAHPLLLNYIETLKTIYYKVLIVETLHCLCLVNIMFELSTQKYCMVSGMDLKSPDLPIADIPLLQSDVTQPITMSADEQLL